MREYVTRLLREQYRVHAVSDGLKALDAARRLRPDLVVADVMMPILDGFDLLNAVRNDTALSSTPVILLSARAGEESRVEGLHAGADDYIVKPFTARELLARVGSHLAMSRLRREAHERVSTTLESISDSFIALDPEWRFTYVNAPAERTLQTSRSALLGRVLWDAFPSVCGSEL